MFEFKNGNIIETNLLGFEKYTIVKLNFNHLLVR